MERKQKYTAAIIGTGRIGFTLGFDKKREQPASHTAALRKNKRIELIAGCDTAPERLAQWNSFVKNAFAYDSAASLFASQKPDIAVIAVNEDAHLETALAAIRARPRLIILEKPVALNMQDGKTIAEEALSYGVPVLINHERRFADDYRLAKKHIRTIGKIQSVNARLDSGLRVYSPETEATGAYSLLHDGTHLVDAVMFLLEGADFTDALESGASDCSAPPLPLLNDIQISSIYYDEKQSDTVRNVSVRCASPACADINLHFSGRSRYFGFEIDVIGTEGRIKIGNGIFDVFRRGESKLYTGFYSLMPDQKVKRCKKTRYFSNMVQNAVDFLDGNAALGSTLQTGMNVLAVLEEIKEEIKRRSGQ
ncbi:MAG: Gfo/Idh/MocA family protein [Treponema sp.]